MPGDPAYQRIIARLRALRVAQGLTLAEVESRSSGVWKAVVVGSYERGSRKITLERAQALCTFYGVELAALTDLSPSINFADRITLDLARLRELRGATDSLSTNLFKLARWIATSRSDWNGQVLSIRSTDLSLLEITSELSRPELIATLERRKVILKVPDLL